MRVGALLLLFGALAGLLAGASFVISGQNSHAAATHAKPKSAAAIKRSVPPKVAHAREKSHRPAVPLQPPARTPIAVFNASGVTGVAHDLAARLSRAGYPITMVGDTHVRPGAKTTVMFRPPFGPAARKIVKRIPGAQGPYPLDGMRPSQIGKAKVVVIIAG